MQQQQSIKGLKVNTVDGKQYSVYLPLRAFIELVQVFTVKSLQALQLGYQKIVRSWSDRHSTQFACLFLASVVLSIAIV
jgi:hypothetical protein